MTERSSRKIRKIDIIETSDSIDKLRLESSSKSELIKKLIITTATPV
jgi:hypothetical protein